MSKLKKVLLLCTANLLVAALAIGGTLAYLQNTDSDVNVMTLGNVAIEQIELQRAEDVAHNAGESGKGNGVINGALVPFVQNQKIFPAVPKNNAATDYTAEATDLFYWGDYVYSGTAGNGLWNDNKLANVMDKMIFVKNTGKSDAYVRTLIAFECPEGMEFSQGPDKEFMMNINGSKTLYAWEEIGYITVDGVRYLVMEATYLNALNPGNTAHPSLLQVVMTHNATNEDMELLGDTYEILAVSQAVQAAGFADAKTALDTAFGKTADKATEWFGGKVIYASDLDDIKKAFAEGGTVILTDDIKFEKITPIEPGKEVYLNLNGKTITVDEDTKSNTLIWVKDGAKLTIDGNGTIDLGSVSTMAIFCPYGELVIENGTFIRDKVTTVTDATTGLFMGAKNSGCNVTINGGYFDPGYYDANADDIEGILAGTVAFEETDADKANHNKPGDKNAVRTAIKDNVSVVLNHSGYGSFKVYGGTFVGANPAWGDEGCMLPTTPNYLRPWSYYQGALLDGQVFNENGIVLPDGYTITRTVNADGVPVYTVNYSK